MPETTKLHPKQPVAAALASRAAVRPALRQGGAFALGLAGGWAVLYGALLPFGLGLTLGLPEDCFAAGAAGAAALPLPPTWASIFPPCCGPSAARRS